MTKHTLEKIKSKLLEEGGLTYSVHHDEFSTLKSGYMVSLKSYEFTYKNVDNLLLNIDRHINYILNNFNDNYYLGIWLYNGLYYLDISEHITNKKKALRVAKKRQQLAIFDLKNNRDIMLNYDISFYSVYKNGSIILQGETLDEVADKLGWSLIYIMKIYNKSISGDIEIIKDNINIKELKNIGF